MMENSAIRKPSYEECFRILKEYGTPPNVIGHCKAVAHTSLVIGRRLRALGKDLDLDLIQAAGLLHDVARVKPSHDKVGSVLLGEMGYPEVGEIIRVHMRYPEFNKPENFNETDIVCLGDRLCRDDEYVGLDERMAYIMHKFRDNREAVERIKEHMVEVRAAVCELEEYMGHTIDDLMEQHPLEEEVWGGWPRN